MSLLSRLAALALLLSLASAQSAPQSLTSNDITALKQIAQKLRPAVLRVEDCPAKACRNVDGVGTAFFIGDGLALTAYHVVFGAKDISVRTSSGKVYPATLIGYDDLHDLALLKVPVQKNVSLPLTKRLPTLGEAIFAIGNGGTSFLRPQLGRVTRQNADSGEGDLTAGTLETNLTLMPGDSGGPVLNRAGEVVGVADHVVWTGGTTDGEYRAYAVPLMQGDPRLTDLKNGVKRDAAVAGLGLLGDLGLLQNLPASNFAKAGAELGLGLGETPGAFFNMVTPGGPAARAGLQPLRYDASGKRLQGDLITAVAGQRVNNFSEFQRAVRRHRPEETVALSVIRSGQSLTIPIKLAPRSKTPN